MATELHTYINGLTEDTSPDITADFVVTRDTSATAAKKVKLQNLVGTVLAALRTVFTPASSSGAASMQFHEDTDNGTNKHTLQGQAALASDVTNTLPPVTSTLGYLNVPQNSQSVDYTLVLTDAGKHIYQTGAGKTITIPANASVAFEIGTAVSFIATDSGGCTIAIASDTLRWAADGSTGSRTLAQYGIATAIKVTSTSWIISGEGLS